MTSSTNNLLRGAVALILVGLAWFGLSPLLLAPENGFHRPVRRMQGEDWLAMSRGERFYFVYGFHRGEWEGHQRTCLKIYDLIGNPSLLDTNNIGYKCRGSLYAVRNDPDFVVEHITAFYNGYPAHRSVSVQNLIDIFSDPQAPTLEALDAEIRKTGSRLSPEESKKPR